MKAPKDPTRRQFIRRTLTGATLLGLGSATGALVPSSAPAAPAAPKPGRTLGKEFSYNLSALTQVDSALVRYDETGKIATGFETVSSLAISSDDRVYVAGDRAIRIFSKAGQRLSELAMADQPGCLALAKNGSIYVGMGNHVEVFNAQGSQQAKWETLGNKAIVTALAVGDKDVFVADAGNRIVHRFDLFGKKLGVVGKKDLANSIVGFDVPSPYFDLAIGPDGLLWVVNPARHRLEAYSFDGKFVRAWGEAANNIQGFCGCCNPVHFVRLADGRFVTAEKGLPRVKIYSAEGTFECVVAGPQLFQKQLDNPKGVKICMDLAINSAGHILLADAVSRDIRIFSPKSASEKRS